MNKINYKTMNYSFTGYPGQSGMTLVVSLVILIALTMLGVTSMQSTRTEVAMAGNLREANITFNAAEAGLRAAEDYVNNTVATAFFNDPSIGLYDELDNDPFYNVSSTWDASQTASTSLPYVLEQPRFIIHYLGDRSQNEVGAVNIGGYGSGQPGLTISNFRITARGTGQSGNTYRMVQSYFGHEY
jgi:type IV pilus assembly protein PilX